MVRKILIATDFSPPAIEAQRVGLMLAKQLGASVTLLHAYPVPTYLFFDGSSYIPPAHVVADIVAEASRHMAQAVDAATSSGVPITSALAEGDPVEEILRHATEQGFDLLVVGTHGRRGLGRLALGSVAEQVVRAGKVPVVTVPAER